MATFNVGRPEASEYAPHAKSYVDLVPGDDPVSVLREQIGKTAGLFDGVDDRHASEWSYQPGKWTLKQALGHMTDTERIFAYRALRVGRGDRTPLPGFEQDGFVATADSNERPLSDLLDEFRVVRAATLALVNGFPAQAWERRGTVSEREVSVRGIVFTAAGHELHHYGLLVERYGLGQR